MAEPGAAPPDPQSDPPAAPPSRPDAKPDETKPQADKPEEQEEPNAVSQILFAPFSLIGETVMLWVDMILGVMGFLGDLIIVIGKTFGFMFRGAIDIPRTLAQAAFIGVDSLGIVLICVGFTGMTVSNVLMQQVEQYGAGAQFIGAAMLWAMSKELAPVLAGLILAGRAGAGMASEIGSMKVTEQIDALRATGVHPIRYLAVPRVLASLVMTPLVTFCAAVVGIVAGYLSAHYTSIIHLSFNLYFDSVKTAFRWQMAQALMQKSLVFGIIVAAVAVTEGFNTTGGAEGVGRSTTRAVVNAMILVFFADLLMTIVFRV
ncbi:MAG: ABC transporter permease [bacterium]